MNLRHAHKTRFWYHLGVFSKFSDEHPRHFYLAKGNGNTTDIKPTQLSTKFKAIWSQFVFVPVHLFTDGSFLLLNYSALCLMGFKSRINKVQGNLESICRCPVSIPFRGLRVACSKVIAQGYRSAKCICASYIYNLLLLKW